MTAFFSYPKAASFGRILPKSKIYEHANASAKLKQLFVDQVDQIIWQFKLAPETINLSATKAVPEIQIFHIKLRSRELDNEVLRAIDKAVAFPIVFELIFNGKQKAVAAYKRPSEADKGKWVVSEYFETEWETEDKSRKPMPSSLNLAALYDSVLGSLIPASPNQDEPIAKRVERLEEVRAKEREISRIEGRLAREKQFNKRIAINAELREAKKALKHLGGVSEPQE